jgi:hydrogenase expression/formation protein HypC
MCLGIPGRVVELPSSHPDIGRVDVEGVVRDINLGLMSDDPPAPGEWVLIHLGFALQRMTGAEVEDARSTLAVLGEGGDDPFASFMFDDDTYTPAGYGERAS